MEAPKNQHQQVLHYLIHWKEFSMKDVINDSLFYKFQTRLGEIENDISCFIAERTRKSFTNKFGNNGSHNTYTACIPEEKLIELYNKYN
jgi:hypothetical protein